MKITSTIKSALVYTIVLTHVLSNQIMFAAQSPASSNDTSTTDWAAYAAQCHPNKPDQVPAGYQWHKVANPHAEKEHNKYHWALVADYDEHAEKKSKKRKIDLLHNDVNQKNKKSQGTKEAVVPSLSNDVLLLVFAQRVESFIQNRSCEMLIDLLHDIASLDRTNKQLHNAFQYLLSMPLAHHQNTPRVFKIIHALIYFYFPELQKEAFFNEKRELVTFPYIVNALWAEGHSAQNQKIWGLPEIEKMLCHNIYQVCNENNDMIGHALQSRNFDMLISYMLTLEKYPETFKSPLQNYFESDTTEALSFCTLASLLQKSIHLNNDGINSLVKLACYDKNGKFVQTLEGGFRRLALTSTLTKEQLEQSRELLRNIIHSTGGRMGQIMELVGDEHLPLFLQEAHKNTKAFSFLCAIVTGYLIKNASSTTATDLMKTIRSTIKIFENNTDIMRMGPSPLDGSYLLHAIVQSPVFDEVINLLIKHNIKIYINLEDPFNKNTALHVAVLDDHPNINTIRRLIHLGINTSLRNVDGSTALDIARNRLLPQEILELLERNTIENII